MRRLLIAAGAALVLAGVVHAEPASLKGLRPLDAADRRDITEDLADTLQRQTADPARGARYAVVLRARLAAGAYDGLSDATAFGQAVTADLRAVDEDDRLPLRAYASRNARPETASATAAAN